MKELSCLGTCDLCLMFCCTSGDVCSLGTRSHDMGNKALNFEGALTSKKNVTIVRSFHEDCCSAEQLAKFEPP